MRGKKFFLSFFSLLFSVLLLSVNVSAGYIPLYGKGGYLPTVEHYQRVADGTEDSRDDPDYWSSVLGDSVHYTIFYGDEKEIFRTDQKKVLVLSFEVSPAISSCPIKEWEWDRIFFRFFTLDDEAYAVIYPLRNYLESAPKKDRTVFTVQELIVKSGVPDASRIGLVECCSYWLYVESLEYRFLDYTDGWNEIDGNRYYIGSDGTIFTQSSVIDGIRYKFDKSGVCQGKYTGYTKSGKGRRYWKDGELLKNTWISVKGERKYYADSNGYFVTGTRKIRGKTFVFDENGVLQK